MGRVRAFFRSTHIEASRAAVLPLSCSREARMQTRTDGTGVGPGEEEPCP
jgi:hypothetical protein